MAVLDEYLWLVVVGAIGAFGFGWGTGANDVANAFGTSIGSKALTLKQATIIAAIFEFIGALVLGRVSTNTIAGGIADISSFTREPEIYAYGMVCALGVGSVWLALTSYLELNVSSTHTIIGGIIGFALVYDGSDGVNWADKDTKSFPPYKGVLPIVLGWFIAPFLTGAAAALFFFLLRTVVLRRKNAFHLSFWVLPPVVFAVTMVNMYFVFTKGAKKYLTEEGKDWSDKKSTWVSAVIAAGLFLLTAIVAVPWLKHVVNKRITSEKEAAEMVTMDRAEDQDQELKVEPAAADAYGEDVKPSIFKRMVKLATHGVNVDVHKVVKEDPVVGQIHEAAEKFDPHVEYVFAYLQVFSAICVIFAHGAGEVGYMAGPLATIWDVYTNGKLSSKVVPPVWIILIGAVGLVIGLATYGYNVTRAMGVKLAKLSPTRGMCAELATAFVIMIGAQFGLPTSSSQCITGAIVGIGIMEGIRGVNWKVFAEQFASWVSTLVVIGLCTAALFSQGVYSPSIPAGKSVLQYENGVTQISKDILVNFDANLQSFQQASLQNAVPELNSTTWIALNETIHDIKIYNATKNPSVDVDVIIAQLRSTLALVQKYSVDALGQSRVYPGALLCNTNTTANNATASSPCRSPFLLKT
uniref:Phosphate transporter n=1 Tax=Pteris ensiformis TaxID=265700 RepID=A0AA96C237_9MONI|nr:phosphate transporter B 1;2 [Pteris ensiformis]